MRIDELASDWEVEEMRQELRSGDAPDIVAFRHGMPCSAVRELRARDGHNRHMRKRFERWTDAEKAFVRDNYPNHGRLWCGWSMLNRTWDAIRMCASYLGVKKRVKCANGGWRKSSGMLLHPRRG